MPSNSMYNDLQEFLSLSQAELCFSFFLSSSGGAVRISLNRSLNFAVAIYDICKQLGFTRLPLKFLFRKQLNLPGEKVPV